MNVAWSNKCVPWITKDGFLDAAKFPIEGILQQAMEGDARTFESGVAILRMMYGRGRKEAGVFLLGLLVASDDNWDRRLAIIEALRDVQTEACARLLFAELRRIKSSNTTRRYLNGVIKTLAALPAELVQEGFDALAQDPSFSYRMRGKFRAATAGEPDFPSDWL
jgi:hypothetical protein